MARICAVTKKKPLVGHKVSHSNHKTKTRFLPNLQLCSFPSELLGSSVQLRLTPSGIRTIEKRGGIDAYVLGSKAAELDANLRKVKKNLLAAKARKEAKAA
jgi:large subunit ribosomal protein L28